MKRLAFKMKLKPGHAAAYQKRHDEIWPELARRLKEAGISDYTIFLDPETHILFAVQNQASPAAAAELPSDVLVRKWWSFMSDIMETNPDRSPVCVPLVEMFHLD